MPLDIPMRLFEGLVTLADTGSFTAAALRLRVSQPALSQSMRRLESIVGVRLIDRHPYGATLTPAGQSLASDARTVLVHIEGAVARAVRAGDGADMPTLVVGFGTTTPRRVTNQVLEIDEHSVGSRIRLEHVPWGDESARLLSGELDVVFLTSDDGADQDHESVEVGTYARLAAFPVNHAFAGLDSISISELDREPIIDAGSDRDYWLALPRPSGARPPIISPPARTVEEMLAFVSAGRGMAITSASVAESNASPAVRFVLIQDLPPVTLRLARLRDDDRPRIHEFIRSAATALK